MLRNENGGEQGRKQATVFRNQPLLYIRNLQHSTLIKYPHLHVFPNPRQDFSLKP
jgi:hypothetical protein